MKAVLIYLSGEQSLHDLTEGAIFAGGTFQGRQGEPSIEPRIVAVSVGYKQVALCIFTLRAEESYKQETGNLPVYREVPWVLAG